ncbi:MAG: citryl-CoA lyase [Nevskia sp.]|nr:citryl-CoA lyase [Nevskia sp.]
MTQRHATSSICTYNTKQIFVRGEDLCESLIGGVSLGDFIYLIVLGTRPTAAQRAIVEAAIVALADHGIAPSVVAARITYMGAPESLQGAVAAGLLGVGDQFVGTVELTAPLLVEMVSHPDGLEAAARAIVQRHGEQKKLLPGFGQPHHKPDDPRPAALFKVAEAHGVSGRYVAALKALSRAFDESLGRHMTINAPGAIAALFLEIGVPLKIMRGFLVISRCIGLVGHLHEEQNKPAGRAMWEAAAHAVEYDGKAPPASA